MLNHDISEWTEETLDGFCKTQIAEGPTLDFKRELHIATREQRKELARDLTSFANAAGGRIIAWRSPRGRTTCRVRRRRWLL